MSIRARLGLVLVCGLVVASSACSGHEAAKTISDPGAGARTQVTQHNQQTQDLEQQTGG